MADTTLCYPPSLRRPSCSIVHQSDTSRSETMHHTYLSSSPPKAGRPMVHSVSRWTRGVQVKLWDPLRTRAIPKRLRCVITTRHYTNPPLPLSLPLPSSPDSHFTIRQFCALKNLRVIINIIIVVVIISGSVPVAQPLNKPQCPLGWRADDTRRPRLKSRSGREFFSAIEIANMPWD